VSARADRSPSAASPLGLPIAEMKPRYDVVVVGSGYGGAVAASRLSRAGSSVCLLERGNEIEAGDYPNTEQEMFEALQVDSRSFHKRSRTGLYDMRLNDDVDVFVGCGLGGTSLVNAGVALNPDPRVFDDPVWPKELKDDVPVGLAAGFQRAREMLNPKPYPDHFPKLAKLAALEASAEGMGHGKRFYRPPINVTFVDGPNNVGVEQCACKLCGDCVSGCNYRAKNTLLMNYLPDARCHDAEIFPGAAVRVIEPGEAGWRVQYHALETGWEPFDAPTKAVEARIVILAAGTLGSTEILLRSAEQELLSVSDRLGTRFTGNGDVLAFAYNADREINGIGAGSGPPQDPAPVGPCITGFIDLRNTHELEHGMVIEEGAVPGGMDRLVRTMLTAASHLEGVETEPGIGPRLRKARREAESCLRGPREGAMRNTQTFLVMSHDAGDGRLRLEDDRVRVEWHGAGSERVFKAIDRRLEAASAVLGATYVRDPIWTKLLNHKLVTVHPLGGCPIGADGRSGVVDHRGRVYADADEKLHDGLYVLDGSIVPRPLGVNPLLTISALAERACAIIATERRR
jgi:cholesterol oxidase